MKTVHVLHNGCYSDRRIVGVFSSAENAESMSRIWADEPSVEEWAIDEFSAAVASGKRLWFVRLAKDSGDVQECYQDDSAYGQHQNDCSPDVKGGVYTHCWAKDREHAIKIASERRRQYLAAEVPA